VLVVGKYNDWRFPKKPKNKNTTTIEECLKKNPTTSIIRIQ